MHNLDLESAHNMGQWAWDFLQTAFDHGQPNPTSQHLMEAAYRLSSMSPVDYDDANAHQQRVAIILTIDAALTDPDGVMSALRYVRAQLVREDPALGVIGGK